MIRGIEIVKGFVGEAADRVVLDYDHRHRRRMAMTGEMGTAFLLDLAEVPDLRDGDAIRLENGDVIGVSAAPEDLMEIHAHDAVQLMRIVWHIGNRHLAAEISGASVLIRADHVIADMVTGLGGHVHKVHAPFNPERGAYAGQGTGHAHDHTHHHHDHD